MRFSKGFKSLMAFCLCFLLWTANIGLVHAQSQSTEKVDFTISNVKDFSSVITRMKNGDDFTGKVVKVTADIDFSGAEFMQVPSFGGTLDGSGHTFSGISGKSGLLKEIKSTGIVKNLTIKDSSFNGEGEDSGAFASKNYGTIENCTSYASVETNNGGGIACYNYGTIINCINFGKIKTWWFKIGGIAATNENSDSKIINCYNQGNLISGRSDMTYTAGIVYESIGKAINCYNVGMAKYGISNSGTISSCYFLASASATAMPGTYSDNNAIAMTQSEMSSDAFVAKLNKGAANNQGALTWESGALYPQLVPTYEVTFEKNYSNGAVGSNYSYTTKGTMVTLTSKPADKYYTTSLTINTEEGISVDVTAKGNKFTFIMPENNVVVNVAFATVEVPKNVKYTKSSKTIAWDKVTDATGYEVYRSTSNNKNFKLLKSITTLEYSDSSASVTTTYYYKVRAYVLVDGAKVYGALSSVVSSK